jgi:hypothetical protein
LVDEETSHKLAQKPKKGNLKKKKKKRKGAKATPVQLATVK